VRDAVAVTVTVTDAYAYTDPIAEPIAVSILRT
jgi:hypothetical protein